MHRYREFGLVSEQDEILRRAFRDGFKRAGLFDWLFAADRRFAMERVVALTAAVVLAVSGFMLGGGLGASVAEERYALNMPHPTSTDTSNELTEFLVSDGI